MHTERLERNSPDKQPLKTPVLPHIFICMGTQVCGATGSVLVTKGTSFYEVHLLDVL